MSYIRMFTLVLATVAALLVCQPFAKPAITILFPKGGESFVAGNTIPFTWQWSGEEAPLEPTIYLYSVDSKKTIYGSIPDATYEPNADAQKGEFGALSYYHVVNGKPDGYPPGFIPGGNYRIKIAEYPEGTNNPAYPVKPPRAGYSETFTIVAP